MKTPKENRDEIRENALTIPMRKDEKEKIRLISQRLGLSMSCLARIALNEFLQKEEVK